VDKDYFQRIHARHYVASGDGWHGNPDRETLELIQAARPDNQYTLHLTYTAAHLDQVHADYAKQKGHAFNPKKQGVAPVVDALRTAGVTVKEGPVVIDLSKD